jgi:hypothetical protein
MLSATCNMMHAVFLKLISNLLMSSFYFDFFVLSMRFYWWGYAVVQLVEALRCKPEGRAFDSRW